MSDLRKRVMTRLSELPIFGTDRDMVEAFLKKAAADIEATTVRVSTAAARLKLPPVDKEAMASFSGKIYEDQAEYADANAASLLKARRHAPDVAQGAPVTPEQLAPINKKKEAVVRVRAGSEQLASDGDDAVLIADLLLLCYCNHMADTAAEMISEADPGVVERLLSETAAIRELEAREQQQKAGDQALLDKQKTLLEEELAQKRGQADALATEQALRRGEEPDPEQILAAAAHLDQPAGTPSDKGKKPPLKGGTRKNVR